VTFTGKGTRRQVPVACSEDFYGHCTKSARPGRKLSGVTTSRERLPTLYPPLKT
jgi:hypothetical protein